MVLAYIAAVCYCLAFLHTTVDFSLRRFRLTMLNVRNVSAGHFSVNTEGLTYVADWILIRMYNFVHKILLSSPMFYIYVLTAVEENAYISMTRTDW